MNYKLSKLVCSVAIVSTIMPLTACQKKQEDITLSRKNELTYLINPLDWNNVPDYVNIQIKNNYMTMDIDSFYRLLNNSDKDFIIETDNKQIVLNKQILKDKIQQEFSEYNISSLEDYIKVVITIIEGPILFIIGNKVITFSENTKEKIKKKS